MKSILPSLTLFTILSLAATTPAAATNVPTPVKIIFDTDIGNDVDDALALGLLHSLQTRGACELLGVTITRCDELAGPYVNAINRFYGRPQLPVGCIRGTPESDPNKFLPLVKVRDGDAFRYPHELKRSSDAPDALKLLRRLLSAQRPDLGQWFRAESGTVFPNCGWQSERDTDPAAGMAPPPHWRHLPIRSRPEMRLPPTIGRVESGQQKHCPNPIKPVRRSAGMCWPRGHNHKPACARRWYPTSRHNVAP